MHHSQEQLTNVAICNQKYVLVKRLFRNSFYDTYMARKVEFKVQENKHVLAKIESENSKTQLLLREGKLMKNMYTETEGFLQVISYGSQKGFNYLIYELVGPNLQDLFMLCGGVFSLGTVVQIAKQLVQLLKILHDKGIVLRYWSPDLFSFGLGKNSHRLVINQLGFAGHFYDGLSQQHIEYLENRNINQPNKFSSCNAILGIECSRRDDIESLCYLLIYFTKGKLPWAQSRHDHQLQNQHKIQISTEILCKKMPIEFANLLNYAKSLGFKEEPDYEWLLDEIERITELDLSFSYDWFLLDSEIVHQTEGCVLDLRRRQEGAIEISKLDLLDEY